MCKETPIGRSLAMIEERIREKLTVEALADGIHFSKYHYQRMFREAVGESVMRYVTRRKLVLAAGELAGTRDTVLEIALRYGYDSHEGFTRSFAAYMGMTPTEYRKYHYAVASLRVGKEKREMMYSKATDEIIRELNGLIVEAKEQTGLTMARALPEHREAFEQMTGKYRQLARYARMKTGKIADFLSELATLIF